VPLFNALRLAEPPLPPDATQNQWPPATILSLYWLVARTVLLGTIPVTHFYYFFALSAGSNEPPIIQHAIQGILTIIQS